MLGVLRPKNANKDGLAPDWLALNRIAVNDSAAAERCVTHLIGDSGSMISIEKPSPKDRRKSLGGLPTNTFAVGGGEGSNVLVCSARLLRRMGNKAVQRAMQRVDPGNGNGPTPPPATDANILHLQVQSVLAKARWGKATNAMNAGLKMLRLGGGLGGGGGLAAALGGGGAKPAAGGLLGAAAAPPAAAAPGAPPPVKAPSEAVAFKQEDVLPASPKISKTIPKQADCIACCKGVEGAFAFVYMDVQREFIFAARSLDGLAKLYWMKLEDGTLIFSTEELRMTEELEDYTDSWEEVKPGHYFVGVPGDTPKFIQFTTSSCHIEISDSDIVHAPKIVADHN